MALQSNLYRRGAAYVWRRRLPARLGGKILQISLRTNEALLARRLAAIVSAESNRIFDAMIINAEGANLAPNSLPCQRQPSRA